MESFKYSYFNYSYSFKTSFENLVKDKGFDVKELWSKVDDAIASLILMKQKIIIEGVIFLAFKQT